MEVYFYANEKAIFIYLEVEELISENYSKE